ncbi:MAG: SUMF1/EgtB/PvdO family nonheme iron enzyme [Myxococcales bacterium]|nr:SUMF1/EgtB/PvdO family nonheme iron enzyme [Myxococcales bacterium]
MIRFATALHLRPSTCDLSLWGTPSLWVALALSVTVASACTVDIPTESSAYVCATDDCPADAVSEDTAGSETDTASGDAGADVATCKTAKGCPTGDACEVPTCDAGVCGLAAAKDKSGCDDGDPCTADDACKGGACKSGAAKDCDDGSVCTTDSCDAKTGCVHKEVTVACDDGDACTVGDKCAKGSCLSGAQNDCDDAKPCTTDSCNKATGCVHGNGTAACDDGNACTEGDKCGGGVCQAGPNKDCDDGTICTKDSCNKATGCVHTDTNEGCDDNNPCTADTCNKTSGCVFTPTSDGCDDGDACTENDKCGANKCLSGPKVTCDDKKECTTDSCNAATGCLFSPTTAACDDGDPCTQGDICAGGECTAGKKTDCDDGKPCTIDACNKAGKCLNTETTGACDDGDACTVGEDCGSGNCKGGTAKTCDDGNACTKDSCDGKAGCVFDPTGGSCDDGDPCTGGDSCTGKTCKGTLSATIACCAKVGGTSADGQCTLTESKGRKMTLVPDGGFWMGCNGTKDTKCAVSEKPQHLVDVSGYWLDVYEVTVAHYTACVTAGKCQTPGTAAGCTYNAANKGQHPVNCVSWDQARAYCQWAGGDLPSEAQWEKAARGGCEQNGGSAGCQSGMRTYPWGETAANCVYAVVYEGKASGCGTGQTSPVGQKPKGVGPYGNHDLIGGMLEWMRDGYDATYYGSFGAKAWPKDPVQSQKTTERVMKGGSWSTLGSSLRASHRAHFSGAQAVAYMGFRCMRTID